jgi:catechol 2,3-dioxygenase-like lactoylglutathione lyase family enzyme
MFNKIDHVEVVTDQLDRSIEFYTSVLGFTVALRERLERSSLGVPMTLVYMKLGHSAVELIPYEGASVDPAPTKEHLGYRLLALEVDDMQRATDYLKGKGVAITWGPRSGEHYARAEMRDPNGYSIELRQWFRK